MGKVTKSYNLATVNPKLAKEWHPTKNHSLTPKDVTPGSNKKVWWRCKKGHEWFTSAAERSRGRNCPYCSGQRVCKDNCLETVNPKISMEWHPTKNGKLKPRDVMPGSDKKVWWKCKKGHEWKASIYSRNKKTKCPFCSGRKINSQYNLKTIYPKIAAEWHSDKNKGLSPETIHPASGIQVWWQCKRGHEWKARVADRAKGRGCPFCSSKTSSIELRILSEMEHLFKNVVHRKKVYNKECDIYLPDYKIAIEYDSSYWHKKREAKDFEKKKHLNNKGIFLINIREVPKKITFW